MARSHKLLLLIIEKQEKFPKEEMFCLTSQMRGQLCSVTSNIVKVLEGKVSRKKFNSIICQDHD